MQGNQELMRRTCQDVLTSSAAGGSAATPVVRQSPGRSSCSLRLGATSLQQFPDSVQRLAPVVSTWLVAPATCVSRCAVSAVDLDGCALPATVISTQQRLQTCMHVLSQKA